jgi:hypothetical protein
MVERSDLMRSFSITVQRVKIIIALIQRFGISKILIAATAKDRDAREGHEQ